MRQLMIAAEVDRIFRWPRGRAMKLARQDKLAHVVLPDGEIRFSEHEIEKLIFGDAVPPAGDGAEGEEVQVAHAG
jgi:hypothetical protein